MSKEKEDVIVDVEEVYSKSEEFVIQNRKPILIAIGVVVAIVAIYFGYSMRLESLEEEAQRNIFKAEQYFEIDSLNKAIYGDGVNYGFLDIIDNFSGTKSANLAHYYLGICYLNLGQYEDAIEQLEAFNSSDIMIAAIAEGALGDAYLELGNTEDAIGQYKKAAESSTNDFTSPIYLLKAGEAAESIQDFEKAVEFYEMIKMDFPESNEGKNIDKYISRASAYIN